MDSIVHVQKRRCSGGYVFDMHSRNRLLVQCINYLIFAVLVIDFLIIKASLDPIMIVLVCNNCYHYGKYPDTCDHHFFRKS